MNETKQAYLGLGANLGDPIQQIVDARSRLTTLDFVLAYQCSCLYLSSPLGYSEQADFVNCVLSLTLGSHISPEELFSYIQKTENSLGRVRDVNNQNAPRKIDIDILLFDDQNINSENLIIPHPRMSKRLFVLEPLLELGIDMARDTDTDFAQQRLSKLSL